MTPRHDNRVTTVRGDDLVDPDMWTVIANRRTLIGSIVFGSVVIALVASLVLPKTYESTVSLLPQLESKESGTLTALLAASGAGGVAQNLGIGLPGLQTTPTDIFVAILKSRVMADEVIKKFNLMDGLSENAPCWRPVKSWRTVSGSR